MLSLIRRLETIEAFDLNGEKFPSDNFVNELFGNLTQVSDDSSWLLIVLSTTKVDVHADLKENFKKRLLAKYEPKNDFSFSFFSSFKIKIERSIILAPL